MATFIKLSDRTINTSVIKQIRKGVASIPDPKAPVKYFDPDTIQVPALFLDLPSKKLLTYTFEDNESRDIEFERIEAILVAKPEVLFKQLLLSPTLIQSMQVEWTGHADSTLKLRIKVVGTGSFVVLVEPDDEGEWKRAENLIAQFGLSIPKTMGEKLKELRAKEYDESGKRKPK